LKDEIAQEIVSELRLIWEELQNLTMAVRSARPMTGVAFSTLM